MKRILYFFVVLFTCMPQLWAQCQTYYIMRQGARLEYAMYDERNRETGRMVNQVLTANRAGTEATIQSTISSTARGARPVTNTFKVRCTAGAMHLEVRSTALGGGTQMDAQGNSVYVEFPARMTAGQNLPDGTGNIDGSISGNGESASFNSNFKVFNRKVLAVENITVPAGTYQAYKIAQETEMGMGAQGVNLGKIRYKGVEWYVKNVGLVRSEGEIVGGGMGRLMRAAGGAKSSMVLISLR